MAEPRQQARVNGTLTGKVSESHLAPSDPTVLKLSFYRFTLSIKRATRFGQRLGHPAIDSPRATKKQMRQKHRQSHYAVMRRDERHSKRGNALPRELQLVPTPRAKRWRQLLRPCIHLELGDDADPADLGELLTCFVVPVPTPQAIPQDCNGLAAITKMGDLPMGDYGSLSFWIDALDHTDSSGT